MLNEGSSRDTSEDGGSDSPSWRPSSQVPWVCVPQLSPEEELQDSKNTAAQAACKFMENKSASLY